MAKKLILKKHGINIVTGLESPAPIFELSYCGEDTLFDQYRGNVYSIPRELVATAYPFCSFSSSSEIFRSTRAYADSLAQQSCK
jgi:hypothetical protein